MHFKVGMSQDPVFMSKFVDAVRKQRSVTMDSFDAFQARIRASARVFTEADLYYRTEGYRPVENLHMSKEMLLFELGKDYHLFPDPFDEVKGG